MRESIRIQALIADVDAVAPDPRRPPTQLRRHNAPASLVDRRPLAENCTCIEYESLHELAAPPHLKDVSDTVLDEYAEAAE